MIVTLDGPAGSGKSSVARRLADRLGVSYLDTGAMYRAVTAAVLDAGLDPAGDPDAVAAFAEQMDFAADFDTEPPRLAINGQDVTPRLRDDDVADCVSDVARLRAVREVLVHAQRAIGASHGGLVTEGRDQGSVVFPDAEVKFYLDASPEVRAKRRYDELVSVGRTPDFEAIRRNIVDRDRKDSTRPDAPLICPDDAQRIDTDGLTLEEVVDLLEQRVAATLPPT